MTPEREVNPPARWCRPRHDPRLHPWPPPHRPFREAGPCGDRCLLGTGGIPLGDTVTMSDTRTRLTPPRLRAQSTRPCRARRLVGLNAHTHTRSWIRVTVTANGRFRPGQPGGCEGTHTVKATVDGCQRIIEFERGKQRLHQTDHGLKGCVGVNPDPHPDPREAGPRVTISLEPRIPPPGLCGEKAPSRTKVDAPDAAAKSRVIFSRR